MKLKIIKVVKTTLLAIISIFMTLNVVSSLPIDAKSIDKGDKILKRIDSNYSTKRKELDKLNGRIYAKFPELSTQINNLALHASVIANGQESDAPDKQPFNITDGLSNTYWSSKLKDQNPYIIIDLENEKMMNHINVYWESGKAKTHKIEVSNDNLNWEPIFFSNKPLQTVDEQIHFDDIMARYIKISVRGVYHEDPLQIADPCTIIRIWEIQVFYDQTNIIDTTKLQLALEYARKQLSGKNDDGTKSDYAKAIVDAQENYKKVYNTSKSIFDNPSSSQTDIDQAIQNLHNANLNLIQNECLEEHEINRINDLLDRYKKIFKDGSSYVNGKEYIDAYQLLKDDLYDTNGNLKINNIVKSSVKKHEQKLNESVLNLQIKDPKLTVKLNEAIFHTMSFEEASLLAKLQGVILFENDAIPIEFLSGTITKKDIEYLRKWTQVTSLKVDLDQDLQYEEEKIFIGGTKESSFKNLKYLSLQGWEKIGEYAFYDCVNLQLINIPDVIEIGYKAFSSKSPKIQIEQLDLPNVQIIDTSFQNWGQLKSIYMPNIREIRGPSFEGCAKLKEITFGPYLTLLDQTNIGNKSLIKIVFDGTSPPVMTKDSFDVKVGSEVIVPGNVISDYYGQKVTNTSIFTKDDINDVFLDWNIQATEHILIRYKVGDMTYMAFVPKDSSIGFNRMPHIQAPKNYTLYGWSESGDLNTKVYTEKDMISKDLTLFPVFIEIKNPITTMNTPPKSNANTGVITGIRFLTSTLGISILGVSLLVVFKRCKVK